MKNKVLEAILESHKNKSNKELSAIAVSLHNDFQSIKSHMIELTETVVEIEDVYDKVMTELQVRLQFEYPKKEIDASRD